MRLLLLLAMLLAVAPAVIIAMLAVTVAHMYFQFDGVATIGSAFGGIPTGSGLGSATGRRILRKFKTMNNPSAIKFSNGWQPTTDGAIGAYPTNNGLINTNVDQPYKVTFNLAAATDTAVLEWCDILTTYGA